eukprot:CAMPEP_0196761776 /NCGR_PEP_ID=MMETSP1095-20130614/1078_1 /TAXON_ID=96789 ORGANISM="Chromulina nebulosa, Strain UTEXLB2642" /NCGR_SAMPLE_ID=MMETSP1095 /ASSEMBLY_ACC=CAM_ASM_000446 /LENGTH=165 /DNA_ID=CAMNT_0042111729 /DNA_START=8 /DNA_END=505 /DNA_ORIENTATION=+
MTDSSVDLVDQPKDWSNWTQYNLGGAFLFGSSLGLIQGYYKYLPPNAGKEPFIEGLPYTRISTVMLKQSAMFSLLSVIYSGGSYLSYQWRGKDDHINQGVGGALLGAFIGLRKNSSHTVFLSSIAIGATGLLSSYCFAAVKTQRDSSNYYTLMPFFNEWVYNKKL